MSHCASTEHVSQTITQRTYCNNYFSPSSVEIAEASTKMHIH